MFILVVFFDQLSIILNRINTIDKVRLNDNRLMRYKHRGCKNFSITFGGKFSFWWFVPMPIQGTFNIEELYE